MSTRWDGSVSAEGKTGEERRLMSELSKLIQRMTLQQMDAYCRAVDGWVDRWQEKIAVATEILRRQSPQVNRRNGPSDA